MNYHEIEIPSGTPLKIAALNKSCQWRAETFWTKEPDTIKWLNTIGPNDHLWDIGANIGLYSCYAAHVRGCMVTAFEPMIPNLFALYYNALANAPTKIKVMPVALAGGETRVEELRITSPEIGSSCHQAGTDRNFAGEVKTWDYRQGIVIMSGDNYAMEAVDVPSHIKIDVDGIENQVVVGLRKMLKGASRPRSLIIECNSNLKAHQDMIDDLNQMGYRHSDEQWKAAWRTDGPFMGVGECIFTREK